MLGDHIYRSSRETSCARQLLEAYQQAWTKAWWVCAGRPKTRSAISARSPASGWRTKRLLNVSEFAEKPTLDYARTNLRVPGLPEGEYLTLFRAVHPQAEAVRLSEGDTSRTTSGNAASSS